MIRALVVDDDFRVARIHAASVERIDGFVCVGEAHSAAEARALIAAEHPDLLILDIYLPDENGLSLLRSLTASGNAPDCIFITAARDVESVREAIGLGAVYYLVKPFGFQQLKEQLESYRTWRDQVTHAATSRQADQATVDALYNLRGANVRARTARNQLPPTMSKILKAIVDATQPLGAAEVADTLGLSRPTAQRYLTDLERRGLVALELSYGATGRPVHRYRLAAE